MKVLVISQYFWPESFRINDLANELKNRGHEVTVLTGLPNYPKGKLFAGYNWYSCGVSDKDGITICRVPLLARGQGKSWQLSLNYLSFVFFSCLLGPIICRGKYDLVFVYEPSPFTVGIPGVLFRYLKKAPLLFWVQDLWPESIIATGSMQSPFLLSQIGKMVRYIYKNCDRILIQSRRFRDPAIKAGADPEKIQYFPNWAEDIYQKEMNDNGITSTINIPSGFRIIFAGNLGAAQSLETIVGAADILKNNEDIHWIILGDGRNKQWMTQKITELQLDKTMHMLGQKPVESMPAYFSQADALLVTLRRDMIFELTIPSKVQSYLASGRPILGALDGEGADIVNTSGAGIAVPAEDAQALADAVLEMYNKTEDERRNMGIMARQYYEKHFNREYLLDDLEETMKDAVGERACVS